MTTAHDGETALVVAVPEAEALVRPVRARHDPSAADGMPAHVTVLYPFMDTTVIDQQTGDLLQALFAAHPPFGCRLTHIGSFTDTAVYLAPEPAAPFVALTEAVAARFPDYPPYRGIHASIVPHLTVALASGATLNHVADAFARRARAALPIAVPVDAVTLFERQAGRWRERARYALGAS